MSTTLVVEIISVIFNNDTFYILNTDKGKAKGHIIDIAGEKLKGMKYRLTGEWNNDSKYGKTFLFTEAEMLMNQLFFFLAKVIKIGEKLAMEIVETFGDEFEDIIKNNPDRLLDIKGVGKKRLQKILTAWEKYSNLRALARFLGAYGISANLITKIYNKFGDSAVDAISNNPYILTQINGVGFLTADKIAMQLGIKENNPLRIIACAEYILSEEANNNGHCYLPLIDLTAKIRELLNIDGHIESEIIKSSKFLVSDEGYIGFQWLYNQEKYIFDFMMKNNVQDNDFIPDDEVNKFLTEYEKRNKIKLSDKQKDAVYQAVKNKVFALTGYAGTGKSSVTKAIMQLLATKNLKIVGCALSGIAARRLNQVSGFPAHTIHSLLGYNPQEKFTYNRNNPLDYDVVVVDECGMINITLFAGLIDALPSHTKLILIGDDAQLPPIGAGNVFSDIVKNNIITVVRLDKVFRQNKNNVINIFAQQIRNTQVPKNYIKRYDDWFFVDCSLKDYFKLKNACSSEAEKKALREQVNSLILHRLLNIVEQNKSRITDPLLDMQILVPQRQGLLGYEMLNNYIQVILNNPSQKADDDKIKRSTLPRMV